MQVHVMTILRKILQAALFCFAVTTVTAGEIDADLQAQIDTMSSSDEVSVIVRFEETFDALAFRREFAQYLKVLYPDPKERKIYREALKRSLLLQQLRQLAVQSSQDLQQWLSGRGLSDTIKVGPLAAGTEPVPEVTTIWICCLAAEVESVPYLPVASGKDRSLLLDLRYGNQLPGAEPPLGFIHLDGLPVLLMQGGLSFAWWFGPPVPWTAMRESLG